ncbi:E3 ubiquitin-protein ligase TRIM39 isoform X7 [Gallus gallus]|uniref:E3 ubiquitin-protein ligase TRIM39 isoform X7 n=1 Tax=Gallus gallus TaxID=9031 RepID=UPI000739EE10|nr:E3 ubiquitin-protein ligase TRIM39 isoform X7 [Gallus gallus]XP_046784545.1 E3 ubiquitin-protein ligase TRIM39 isoform X7 [Gallus gallus]|eukprot:XP_015150495.1 E3 ubiquitin-protein ligase TRIM39 isoform X5 [Gallus gallus]
MMASGKRNADLEEWDAKIRKLTEDFEGSDTELEECDTEDGDLAAEIDNLTAELEERDRKIRKLTSDLGDVDTKLKERDRKITKLSAEIRRLTALLGDRDSKLRKLTAELAKCDATIRLFTVELGERHTKIGELTAEVGDYNRKLRKHAAELEERDLKIREHEAEIRRLTELLEDRDSDVREQDILIRKLSEELEELRGREVEESDLERDELSTEVEKRERRIDELTAELEHYKAKARRCFEEHRRGEEKLVNVTLDPETAHPRLVLSEDQKSVRWEYSLQESPDGPERFDADPCVLGCETFTSGRHCWVVDLTEGQYCAVGVSRESLPRKGAVSFNPDEGIWAVQQWGFKNRALTSPPTPLNLPRVPKKIRISLDYEWGEVAFFDVENQMPIFTFPLTSFGGERLRPWFWVELGSLSLPR